MGLDGLRHPMYLGKVTRPEADAIGQHLDNLVSAQQNNLGLNPHTAQWLADVTGDLREKLAAAGLCDACASATLQVFIDDYIKSREVNTKPRTREIWGQVRRYLLEHWGVNRALRTLNAGDADSFVLHLKREGLGTNTSRRYIGIARQFINAAQRQHLVKDNPFKGISATVENDPEKFIFITPAMTTAVLNACPDAEWKIIVALGRYGGLRVPSELRNLRWADIDFTAGKMKVMSPKTEHHLGGKSRLVPLYPELQPILEEAFKQQAAEGDVYVISAARRAAHYNPRTHLRRIIEDAGLTPWPDLFRNLRASRETELADTFPEHVVCRWMGNSKRIARKHYLHPTDAHFQRAVGAPQNTAHQTTISGSTALQPPKENRVIGDEKPPLESYGDMAMLGTGAEPARPCGHQHLKLARLPISPPERQRGIIAHRLGFPQAFFFQSAALTAPATQYLPPHHPNWSPQPLRLIAPHVQFHHAKLLGVGFDHRAGAGADEHVDAVGRKTSQKGAHRDSPASFLLGLARRRIRQRNQGQQLRIQVRPERNRRQRMKILFLLHLRLKRLQQRRIDFAGGVGQGDGPDQRPQMRQDRRQAAKLRRIHLMPALIHQRDALVVGPKKKHAGSFQARNASTISPYCPSPPANLKCKTRRHVLARL